VASYLVTNLSNNYLVVGDFPLPPHGSIVVDRLTDEIVQSRASNSVSVVEQPSLITIGAQTAGMAMDGTDATGVNQLAGGTGIRGWLSSIFSAMTGISTPAGTASRTVLVDATTGNPITLGITRQFAPTTWKAIASGPGYSIGDLIEQVDEFDLTQNPAVYLSTTWRNVTQNSALSAPTMANLVLASATAAAVTVTSSALPVGAAQDGVDVTGVTQLTGGSGIRGWLSGLFSKFSAVVGTPGSTAPTGAIMNGGVDTSGKAQVLTAIVAHNADNQTVPSTGYSLMTGGVDQLLNSAGNLDRKRSANSDGQAATGIAAEAPMLFNGTNFDRSRSPSADGAAVTGFAGVVPVVYNGTTFDRLKSPGADAAASTGYIASASVVYNGSTWDRVRSPSADGAAVTGFAGVAPVVYNGTTFDRLKSPGGDAQGVGGLIGSAGMVWNGASWDRMPGTVGYGARVQAGNNTVNAVASITRSANTTAYATGQLVANNTLNTSVTPIALTAARVAGGSGVIRKVRLSKTSTNIANAAFRVHFFGTAPTINSGDGATISLTGVASYLGSSDITMDRAWTDGAWGATDTGMTDISFKLASGTTIYAFIEARAAYTPTSAEVFSLTIEALQD